MPTKSVTVGQNDAVTVSATAAPHVAAPAGADAATLAAQGQAAVKILSKRMGDALQRHKNLRLQQQQSPGIEEAELIFPPLLWSLAVYGPIQLTPFANPPSDVNTVIANGGLAAMIGISYTDPTTAPPSNMYLAAKDFRARFSLVNLTNVTAGPTPPSIVNFPGFGNIFDSTTGFVVDGANTPLASPGRFSIDPFHYFLWVFQANVTPGSEGDLYECNFDVDISFAGVPGGGCADYCYNTDYAHGIPATAPFGLPIPQLPDTPNPPTWQSGSARFMVNNFPG